MPLPRILTGLGNALRFDTLDAQAADALQDELLRADVGVDASERIIARLRRGGAARDSLRDSLRQCIAEILAPCECKWSTQAERRPFVVLMVGVNGVGKTTTLAKIAARLKGEGRSVMFAACDTFRAAAIEQLQSWGRRLDVAVIAREHGADAAAVAHDAYSAATARGAEVLLIDTAGRQHTHGDLMEQLGKIKRVLAKSHAALPDETLLTVDAGNGYNALSQAAHFHQAVGLTGFCIAKLDGGAKGGAVVALAEQYGLPIRFVGVGEGDADLRAFNAAEFAAALVGE